MEHNCYVKQYPKPNLVVGIYDYLTTEKVIVDGRVVSRSVYKTDDPSLRHEGLNPDDFYLENLLANGVELKECSIHGSDLLATAHVISRLDSLSLLQKSLNSESHE